MMQNAIDAAIAAGDVLSLQATQAGAGWGCACLHTPIPDGEDRVRAVTARWGPRWPEGS